MPNAMYACIPIELSSSLSLYFSHEDMINLHERKENKYFFFSFEFLFLLFEKKNNNSFPFFIVFFFFCLLCFDGASRCSRDAPEQE